MIHVPHAKILERLRAEALDYKNTGWISDLVHFDPEYSEEEQLIQVNSPEYGATGSIDLAQLATIVQSIISEETR